MTNPKIDISQIISESPVNEPDLQAISAGAAASKFLQEMTTPVQKISSSIQSVDNITGGISGFTVIGGGPGTGKTAFCVQVAYNYTITNGPCLFLSYEQGSRGFFHRLVQRKTGRETHTHPEYFQHKIDGLENAESFQKEMEALQNLYVMDLPNDEEGINSAAIIDIIDHLQNQTGKRVLLVVDSLHYTPLADSDHLDGKRLIDKALKVFTRIQQKTGAAVVCIAHQTKSEVKEKEGGLMNFSGSAMISYACDVAIQLQRAEPGTDQTGRGNLLCRIVKNRFGRTTNEPIRLYFNLTNQKIQDA